VAGKEVCSVSVVFFGYMPITNFCEYDCQKQAAFEMKQCLGLLMLTGIMKEII